MALKKLYGTTQQPFKPITYEPSDTNDIDIVIDNTNRIISANIQPKLKQEYTSQLTKLQQQIINNNSSLNELKLEYDAKLEELTGQDIIINSYISALKSAYELKVAQLELTDEEISNALETYISELRESIQTISADILQIESDLASKATKSDTLDGYGITDAYTKTQIDTMLENAGGLSEEALNQVTAEFNAKIAQSQSELNEYIDKFHPLAFIKTPSPNSATIAYGSTGTIANIEFILNKSPQAINTDLVFEKENSSTSNNVSYKGSWSNISSENQAGQKSSTQVTKTIQAQDAAGNSVTSSLRATFTHYIFYGIGDASLSSSLSSLTKELRSSNQIGDKSANVGSDKYFWYCCPEIYGTPTFKVSGFEGGFNNPIKLTYEYGTVSVSYNCYRTSNSNLGQTTFNIS